MILLKDSVAEEILTFLDKCEGIVVIPTVSRHLCMYMRRKLQLDNVCLNITSNVLCGRNG